MRNIRRIRSQRLIRMQHAQTCCLSAPRKVCLASRTNKQRQLSINNFVTNADVLKRNRTGLPSRSQKNVHRTSTRSSARILWRSISLCARYCAGRLLIVSPNFSRIAFTLLVIGCSVVVKTTIPWTLSAELSEERVLVVPFVTSYCSLLFSSTISTWHPALKALLTSSVKSCSLTSRRPERELCGWPSTLRVFSLFFPRLICEP